MSLEAVLPAASASFSGTNALAAVLPAARAAFAGTNALAMPLPAVRASFTGTAGRAAAAWEIPALRAAFGNLNTDALVGVFPAPTTSFTGKVGIGVTEFDIDVPAVTASFSGKVGIIGTVAASLGEVTASFSSRNTVAAELPGATAVFTGTTGRVGTLAAILPAPLIGAFTGKTQLVATLDAQARVTASFTGTGGITGSMAATLGRIALAASGYSGVIGTISVTVPVVEADFTGRFNITGSMVIQVPALQLVLTGQAVGTTSAAYALQLRNLALSTYSNYGFNSFATIGSTYLGATSGGIFALTGARDGVTDVSTGTAIAAVVRSGVTDFGSPQVKGIERIWAGYTADGAMDLTVTANGESHTYRLSELDRSDPHSHAVKVGRGLRARYWQFEIENVDGADFTLDAMEFMPEVIKRRHGG